ncbi:hypothetical protein HYQ46_009449 [Verticillium longisporum]|nr:hypothetical protein HYQ46_009449 [Verticillium longisporum]
MALGVLECILSEEGTGVPVLCDGAVNRLGSVDSFVRLGGQDLARDGIQEVDGQVGCCCARGRNDGRVGVEVLVLDFAITKNPADLSDRVVRGTRGHLDDGEALEPAVGAADNDRLLGRPLGRNIANLAIDTNGKKPLAGSAVDNGSGLHLGPGALGKHFDDLACGGLGYDLLAVGSTNGDEAPVVLNKNTFHIPGLARRDGECGGGPRNLSVVANPKLSL